MTKSANNNFTRLDYWQLIDRVACSGKVSPTAVIVLMRLLQHRNTETGRCNPSIRILAKRLFPNLAPRSGYDKVQLALKDLKKADIIHAITQLSSSNIYKFNFGWGIDEVNTSLSDIETTSTAPVKTTSTAPVKTTVQNNKRNSKDEMIKRNAASLDTSTDVRSPPDNEVDLSRDKSIDVCSSPETYWEPNVRLERVARQSRMYDEEEEVRTLTDDELGVTSSPDDDWDAYRADRKAKIAERQAQVRLKYASL